MRQFLALSILVVSAAAATANPPVASYIFPAGGQRGREVAVKVGGLFLHQRCGFEMLGPGAQFPEELTRVPTLWFEGPLLPLPDSQRAEDYPKDMAGTIKIAKDAALGLRPWRLWTSQGGTPSMKFVVGALPEIVENEIDGAAVPVNVALPVTINGRIFPRADVDIWSFTAKQRQSVWCEVSAARLGTPLDARLEIRDSQGRRLAENDDNGGPDPRLRFTAPADGIYHVHIHDIQYQGSQSHVYRLTLTSEPMIERVFPLGGRRGSRVTVQLEGQDVPANPVEVTIPADTAETFAWRAGGVSPLITSPDPVPSNQGANAPRSSVLLDVDDAPELIEDRSARTMPITLPAIFNGRIAQPGEVDVWPFAGKKGEALMFEVRAGVLGSPLDGVITLRDAADKQLARAEASGNQLDPTLNFTLPADGVYTLHVQDRFASRGGPAFAYRVRALKAPPAGYRLTLAADAVTVLRQEKQTAKLKVTAERRGGFKEPIALTVQGLPAGVSVANTTIAASQNQTDLTFKAEPGAKIGVTRVRITGTAKIGGKEAARAALLPGPRGELDVDDILLGVAMPTPFVIKGEYEMGFAARGSLHQRKYKIERNGYTGPIEVSLTDRQARHLQGVTGPTIVVPADKDEFVYTAMLPPWMETGRTSRTCVMGVGVVKDADGSEHRVSFSSVNQNEQLVAVVGPGQLALELERQSCIAAAGQSAVVPFRIQRGLNIKGDVKLELITPPHIRGVSADALTLAPDQERGRLMVRFASKLDGPFNMPLIVRATMLQGGVPIIAEATLDVRP